ncbi:Coumaroyl-CoA:anthocyanidin 3-O-glucoside-6''-O-coumaroyltransferase 2 [Linum grandiflorum]
MANNSHQLKLIHRLQVSPAPPTSAAVLPLTCLDYPWLFCRPMQRLFLYDFPHTTHHFTQNTLPELQQSLSVALRHFFPLAGKLISPPRPCLPHLCFSDGDSVPLTVAESAADFDQLVSNHPRNAGELSPLVPELPNSVLKPDGSRLVPLLAIQITLFPGKGISVGAQFAHVVSDGVAFHDFLKLWASLCKKNASSVEDLAALPLLPSHEKEREIIRRAYPDLESTLANQWFELGFGSGWDFDSSRTGDLTAGTDKVRLTLVITRSMIERIKLWIRGINPTPFHLSAFVVTSALVWTLMIKSVAIGEESAGPETLYHLNFVADCRSRLGVDGLSAGSYFGNCLSHYYVSVKRGDAASWNGVAAAAEVIGKKVGEVNDGGAGLLKEAERWVPEWNERAGGGRMVSIAGSPKLRAYETDFGWGKPRKSEVVHLADGKGIVALCDSGDGNGGVEVGLAMERSKMEVFSRLFEEFLAQV